jgi:hypothetical protein
MHGRVLMIVAAGGAALVLVIMVMVMVMTAFRVPAHQRGDLHNVW